MNKKVILELEAYGWRCVGGGGEMIIWYSSEEAC